MEQRQEREKQKDRMQDELLFNIQGVGSIKKVNNYDVYVKNKDCYGSLQYLSKLIKNESDFDPWVKQILGEWTFLENDLIPLLVFHKKDKMTSFLVCMLMVQLTDLPRTSEEIKN